MNSVGLAHPTHEASAVKYINGGPIAVFLVFYMCAHGAFAKESVNVQELLKATGSWDGTFYTNYSAGPAQPTLIKISIPANTVMAWHQHQTISVAYVLSGVLFVEKKNSTDRITVKAGESLAEMVDIAHRGYTTTEPVELLVFYANVAGLPLAELIDK